LPLGELDADGRALLFTEARSANKFTDTPVTDEQLRDIYELFHYAPTQSNTNPLRILFVQSPEARARLLPHFEEDIALLGELTGDDFSLWLAEESRGSFEQRAAISAGSTRSADDGHQVVRTVGPGGLDVEPGPPFGKRHGRRVAEGSVGVRRGDRRVVGGDQTVR
jgi:nitroreductase